MLPLRGLDSLLNVHFGDGAPAGDRNGQYRHGAFTKQAIIEKRWVRSLLRTLLGSKGADHE